MPPGGETQGVLQFGRFQLSPSSGELVIDGVPVRLGSRAFEILMVLIEARGRLVTKDELMSRVWPSTFVAENSLQVHISALRKALGRDRGFIQTVSGRGYRFVPEVVTIAAGATGFSGHRLTMTEPLASAATPTNLPAPISDLIGRETELADVADLIAAHRLVTLIGAGGIGKTRLALEVARRLLPDMVDGIWVAELAPLSNPGLVAATVAATLGLELAGGGASPERVAEALGSKRLLLVLDNCEHVIDAAASLAEVLVRANPTARVMATSREPLRIESEFIYRVPPLDVPAEDIGDIEDVLQHDAVRLFVARARAADSRFVPDQHVAGITGIVCRRLDGAPLAIELAAARAAALGVAGVAARLDDRFRLLTGGRRTAQPRHQTLRATLDWSYELLPEPERAVLRHLAIFTGGFSLEAASAVAASKKIAAVEIADCIANLVSKSLVSADVGGTTVGYRLAETTRAYALEKLGESGELEQVARRHAAYGAPNSLRVTQPSAACDAGSQARTETASVPTNLPTSIGRIMANGRGRADTGESVNTG